MTITVILGAQWGMFLSLTCNISFLRTQPMSVPSHLLTRTSTGDEGVSIRGEPHTADHTQLLTILRTQKGKLVDGQCQEAQLCARAAVSTAQAESGRPTASINLQG